MKTIFSRFNYNAALWALLIFSLPLTACQQNSSHNAASSQTSTPQKDWENEPGLKKAYFASGCFWCATAVFGEVKGVKQAIAGYSGGTKPNPTYEMVSSGETNYAESVEVIYDPKVVSYEELLRAYFNSEDATQVEGQGPDHGHQYRSIIFYQNDQEKKEAEAYKQKLNASGKYNAPIAAIIQPFEKFYKAEAYHQNYVQHHPENPYVQNVTLPRLHEFEAKCPDLLKK